MLAVLVLVLYLNISLLVFTWTEAKVAMFKDAGAARGHDLNRGQKMEL